MQTQLSMKTVTNYTPITRKSGPICQSRFVMNETWNWASESVSSYIIQYNYLAIANT